MAREVYRDGAVELTVELDLDGQGWSVAFASPPLWASEQMGSAGDQVHSRVLIPFTVYETGIVDEYLDALLAIHFERLGLLQSAW